MSARPLEVEEFELRIVRPEGGKVSLPKLPAHDLLYLATKF